MKKEGKILDLQEYRKKMQEDDSIDMEILRLPEGMRVGPSPWFLEQQKNIMNPNHPTPAG